MKIGIITGSISRNAGGFFNSVRCLSRHLESDRISVRVFAGIDEYSSQDIRHWGSVPVNLSKTYGPVSFGYQPKLIKSLEEAMPDIVHQHGLWSYSSIANLRWSRAGRPTVVSPRGMLEAWAMSYKNNRKRIAWHAFEKRNLAEATCIHALCESEARTIRAYGLKNPVAVIPNGVDIDDGQSAIGDPQWRHRLPKKAKIILFLGRIHPIKGLTNLVDAFHLARCENSCPRWHLVIAGWDENGHRAELERRVIQLGIERVVHFVGPQYGANKAASLAAADVFVLPSLSEGLPMAVLEAWAARLPVFMTPACNLSQGFEEAAAIEIGTSPASIFKAFAKLDAMSSKDLIQMGQNGRRLAENEFGWSRVAAEVRTLYEWILGGGSAPRCVELYS